MNRKMMVLSVLIGSLILLLPVQAQSKAPSKPLVIIGQQKDSIESYLKNIGTPDGLMVYTSIQEANGLDSPSDKGGGIQDAQSYLSDYPAIGIIQIGLYMNGALKDVLEGKYDQNIQKMARWIKQSKKTVYLRIGYEFDLPDNHYDPQEYQKAFKYIVDRFKKLKVDHVYYVWHSAIVPNRETDFEAWYPGDRYVDWFAISYFNPQQEKKAEIFFELAHRHHKPLMIAESTPAGLYTLRGRKDWFNKYFAFIKKHSIGVICYINCNWDKYPLFYNGSWGDSRVEKNEELKELWLKFLSDIKK